MSKVSLEQLKDNLKKHTLARITGFSHETSMLISDFAACWCVCVHSDITRTILFDAFIMPELPDPVQMIGEMVGSCHMLDNDLTFREERSAQGFCLGEPGAA